MLPKDILIASKNVLSQKNYLIGFLSLMLLIFFIFVLIPVLIIPGNSFYFQLRIFTIKDYLFLSILSILTSLQIIMQIFSYKQKRIYFPGKAVTGSGSAIIAALFGTTACSSCLASLFGFLSVGTVLLLFQYKDIFTAIAIFGLLVSLHFTSKRLNKGCELCK